MSSRRSSPRRLALALASAQGRWEPESVLAEAQRAWAGVVGEVIAGQAVPTGERGGTLTISCAASVWAQELDLMGPDIVERLNQQLERGRIVRLRCVTRPLEEGSPERGRGASRW